MFSFQPSLDIHIVLIYQALLQLLLIELKQSYLYQEIVPRAH